MAGTRYILAGGYDLITPGYADRLIRALEGRKKDAVLSCFFSQPEHKWLSNFNQFKPLFDEVFPKAQVELALLEKFEQQVKAADLIYLHGGETRRILARMKKYSDVEKLFKDKTVIGSSAGANFLSNIWWSYNLREAGKGTGIVPRNIIVHYKSTKGDNDHRGPVDWDQPFKDIAEIAGGEVDITPIPEGELIVYDVS